MCGLAARWPGRPGPCSTGETTLAAHLESAYGPGDLDLADRGFPSREAVAARIDAGKHFAWRVSAAWTLRRAGRPWALLCAYHAVRDLTAAVAALARQDPLRICFVNALDVVRGPVGQPGPLSPDRLARLVTASLTVIAAVTGRERPGRSNPRQAKRSTSYPAKPSDPAKRPKPRGPLTLVMLPMPVRGDT